MTSAVRILEIPFGQPLDSLDDCHVIAALGQGGMAEVFLATRPQQVGEDVIVIKRLHPHLDDDPSVVAMFLDEARVALRLIHPNIVRSYQLGQLQGRHAIVMEYLEGQPIHRVLLRAASLRREVPFEAVVPMIVAALEGLHHAHEASADDGTPLRLVHRDVSPHNLFLTSDGNIKLLDFGIAKTEFQECRTRTGLLKGKVSYMAPEQAWGHTVDCRADLWSVGVVMWEMLTGKRLFKAENEAASLHNTLTAKIPKLSDIRTDIPPELERIVARALQRDPAQRYPTAATMAFELRAWARSCGVSTRSDASRAFFYDLFGDEIIAYRERVEELLAQQENAPISGSMPLPRLHQAPNSGNVPTHLSTTVAVTGRAQQPTRAPPLLWGLVGLGVAALCVIAFERITRTPPPQLLEIVPVAPAAAAAPTAAEPRAVVLAPARSVPAPEMTAAEAAEPSERTKARAQMPRARPATAGREPSTPARSVPERPAEPAAPREPVITEHVPPPAPSAVEHGYLTLDTSPWSNVTADGVSLGQTPIVRAKLPSGTHTLTLSNPEQGLRTSYQVRIEAGKVTARRLGLE